MQLMPRLVDEAFRLGYRVRGKELLRTKAEAELNALQGDGVAHSCHTVGLAIDLALFKNGVYLTRSEDYAPLGIFWENLAVDCCWGGRFHEKPDGNHFSIMYNGVR
jgi:hypothetical protein